VTPSNAPGQPSPPGGAVGQPPASPAGFPAGGDFAGGLPFGAGPTEIAIWFVDDRTVVVGSESLVQAAITQGPTPPTLAPPLAETFSGLGPSAHLAFAAKLDVLKDLVGMLALGIPGLAPGPQGQQVPAGLDKLQAIGLSLSLSQQVEVAFVGHCGSDAAAAAQIQTSINSLIEQGKTFVAAERQKLQTQAGVSTPAGQSSPMAQQIRDVQTKSLAAVETLLKEIKNEVAGGQVRVRVGMPSATVTSLLGLAMSMSAAAGPQGTPGIGSPPPPPNSQFPGLPGAAPGGAPNNPVPGASKSSP
jgi:hypothetical protein